MSLDLDDSILNCKDVHDKLRIILKQVQLCKKHNISDYKYKKYDTIQFQNIIDKNNEILFKTLHDLYPCPTASSNSNKDIHNPVQYENENIIANIKENIYMIYVISGVLEEIKKNNIETFHYESFDIDELIDIIEHNNKILF